jgi:hypothetical protein
MMKVFKLKYESIEAAMEDIEPRNLQDVYYFTDGTGRVDVIAPEDTIFLGEIKNPSKPIHNFL